MLQIVKLHERAVVSGNVTLGIDYIITYGGWSNTVRTHLETLAEKLNRFSSQLRAARNKILSHNDLATIVSGATLGRFADGADEEYFNVLQEFVNTVHVEVVGGPWPFNDLVKNDVYALMVTIKP